MDAVSEIRRALDGSVPLIGFSGSPWTLACYMIEGGASDDYRNEDHDAYSRPDLLHHMLERHRAGGGHYLNAQIEAGAQAVMVFDSWGGALSAHGYKEFSLAYMQQVIAGLRREHDGQRVPSHHVHQGRRPVAGVAISRDRVRRAGPGLDHRHRPWRASASATRWRCRATSIRPPCSHRRRRSRAKPNASSTAFGPHPGHVFNLGHGISQHTPPEHVSALVEPYTATAGRFAPLSAAGGVTPAPPSVKHQIVLFGLDLCTFCRSGVHQRPTRVAIPDVFQVTEVKRKNFRVMLRHCDEKPCAAQV
jgi:uroporphyrinogen decarboxylase